MTAKDPSSRIKAALRGHQQASDPLERVEMSRRIREAAEEMEADAIEQARNSGATWRDIGACYGLTKQGAQQRFGNPSPAEPANGRKKPVLRRSAPAR